VIVALLLPMYRDADYDAQCSTRELIEQWRTLAPADWELRVMDFRGQPVMHTRNVLTALALYEQVDALKLWAPDRALQHDGKAADILLWQDSDVSFDVPDVIALLKTLAAAPDEVALVGMPCLIQSREGDAIPNVNVNGFEESRTHLMAGATMEVAQVGFGLVATRASAYRALGFPWFGFKYAGSLDKVIGEDTGWCDAVRQLGFSIFCDGSRWAYHTFARRFRPDAASQVWLAASGHKG